MSETIAIESQRAWQSLKCKVAICPCVASLLIHATGFQSADA